jgi:hypothetical protein
MLAQATPGYQGLDFRAIGGQGHALPLDAEAATATQEEARA